ncbi:MAG TPA: pyridoxamine 5'-phosphate oxidase family protein [Verrucomicrobiae bacterium]|nr:pyridoxamine 5'-phosphate oxidase family protein [Verrucomicrobiae bacterium]
MAANFLKFLSTDATRQAQQQYYGAVSSPSGMPARDALTPEEIEFIHARDSFYFATVTGGGWPYVQHRGGRPGFLRAVDAQHLAFADYRGNRQMLSVGNLAVNNRATLFLMDYPQRARLKIIGRARVEDARAHPGLSDRFAEPGARRLVERIFFIEVDSFDWNCSQHITPRYTLAEIEELTAPLRERIAELERALAKK